MAVFEADGPREVDLAPADIPVLTVFEDDAWRQVAIGTDWPEIRGGGHLGISAGPRYDTMRWNIGGHGGPNILSELGWKVPAVQLRVDGDWTHVSGFTIKGWLAYAGAVEGGEVRDSDYALDNRQAEFSRSYSKTDEGRMVDASLGAGWRLPLGRSAALTPLLGVARYSSEYRMRDGQQTWVDDDLDGKNDLSSSRRIHNLHSSYKPVWTSYWHGVDAEWQALPRLSLRAAVKQHFFRYKADANWNLRGSFAHPVSFTHQGYGQGWEGDLTADWHLAGGHRLTLDVNKRELRMKNGTDTTYFADDSSGTIRLNEALADSWSARLGYRYEY